MEIQRSVSSSAIAGLRWRWIGFFLLSAAFLVGGSLTLAAFWSRAIALRWAGLAALAVAYQLWVLWQGLPFNHRAGESELLPGLGAGNWMTLLRGLWMAGLIGFLFSPRPEGWLAWLPAILYTLVDLADFLDGYLARITHHATLLGEKLDMSFDGVGVLAASLLAVQYGQAPALYLAVGLARYVFLFGIWIRRRLGKPIYELPRNMGRRAMAGVQMGFLSVLLWPVFGPPGTHLAAALFATPFLIGFFKDFLTVSGSRWLTVERQPGWYRTLPLLLRFFVAGLAFVTLTAWFNGSGGKVLPLILVGLIGIAAALMVLLGVAGRTAAVLGLIGMGLNQTFSGLSLPETLLIAAYVGVLFVGTGMLSLWSPEEAWIQYRAGEARGSS